MAPVHGKISAAPVAPLPDLKVFRPQNPYVALGLAANHLMTKPAFANLRFGDWSRILVGQINRKHYCFAVDGNNQIQGFMGWALTSKENAEAWVEGRGALSFADSLDGDCVVFNAWAANTGKVNRFLLGEARKVIEGKDTVYFKRFYKDGSVRPARLRVNDFVAQHLRRPNGDACPPWTLGSDEQRNEAWLSSTVPTTPRPSMRSTASPMALTTSPATAGMT
jgi:hemolysin-activating ACP:hemolysin acyltransferase